MENQGILGLHVEETVKDIPEITFSIPQYECSAFFAEYARMVKLYTNGNISGNAFGTWLGAELAKLHEIPLPQQFIWKDGKWVVEDIGQAD